MRPPKDCDIREQGENRCGRSVWAARNQPILLIGALPISPTSAIGATIPAEMIWVWCSSPHPALTPVIPACWPSPISSITLALNAGMSSGLRLVTKPLSTTTSSSTQSPPVFLMSL